MLDEFLNNCLIFKENKNLTIIFLLLKTNLLVVY